MLFSCIIIDLTSVIRNFKNKIRSDHPDALPKPIYLTTRNYPLLLEDMMRHKKF